MKYKYKEIINKVIHESLYKMLKIDNLVAKAFNHQVCRKKKTSVATLVRIVGEPILIPF